MDTMKQIVTANGPVCNGAGENSALVQRHTAVVPFRARTRGGAALIGLNLAPDSAPWTSPV